MTVASHSSSSWEVVLSLGMCSVGLVSIPLGYWNLEDNVKVRNLRDPVGFWADVADVAGLREARIPGGAKRSALRYPSVAARQRNFRKCSRSRRSGRKGSWVKSQGPVRRTCREPSGFCSGCSSSVPLASKPNGCQHWEPPFTTWGALSSLTSCCSAFTLLSQPCSPWRPAFCQAWGLKGRLHCGTPVKSCVLNRSSPTVTGFVRFISTVPSWVCEKKPGVPRRAAELRCQN